MSQDLLDEVEVLRSIYGSDQIQYSEYDESDKLKYIDEDRDIILSFIIPSTYPQENDKIKFQINSIRCKIERVDLIERCIQELVRESGAEVVLFRVIEAVKDIIDKRISCVDITPRLTRHIISSDENDFVDAVSDCKLHIIHGPVTTEMKSSFQSHVAAVSSMEDVIMFRTKVLEDKKVARATHNIFAYRFTCKRTAVIYHDNDDDGETAAGSRLAEMIRLMGVDGVAVIVTRWFGGILLGPDRFKYICNSARFLLENHGFMVSQKKKKK